jgi:hypothetical protein
MVATVPRGFPFCFRACGDFARARSTGRKGVGRFAYLAQLGITTFTRLRSMAVQFHRTSSKAVGMDVGWLRGHSALCSKLAYPYKRAKQRKAVLPKGVGSVCGTLPNAEGDHLRICSRWRCLLGTPLSAGDADDMAVPGSCGNGGSHRQHGSALVGVPGQVIHPVSVGDEVLAMKFSGLAWCRRPPFATACGASPEGGLLACPSLSQLLDQLDRVRQRYAQRRSQSRRQHIMARDRSFWTSKVLAGPGM